jgi:hypothetical protein
MRHHADPHDAVALRCRLGAPRGNALRGQCQSKPPGYDTARRGATGDHHSHSWPDHGVQFCTDTVQRTRHLARSVNHWEVDALSCPTIGFINSMRRGTLLAPPSSSSANGTRSLSRRSNLWSTATTSRLWTVLVSSLGYNLGPLTRPTGGGCRCPTTARTRPNSRAPGPTPAVAEERDMAVRVR